MNEDAQVLGQLSAYMASLPEHAPESVLRATLTAVAATRQRRSWLPAVAMPVGEWRLARAAALTFAAVAGLALLVVFAQIVSRLPPNLPPASQNVVAPPRSPLASTTAPTVSPTPPSTPSQTPLASPTLQRTRNFTTPFTFDASGIDASVRLDMANLFDLVSPAIPSLDVNVFLDQYPSDSKGLIVASTSLASADSCPRGLGSSFSIMPGDDVMSVLHDKAGMTFVADNPSPVDTIAGKPAVEATVTTTCLDHLHPAASNSEAVLLARPNTRLFVVPLSDTTLMIQVWAQSAEQLQGWLPQAVSVIESMTLISDAPVPTASSVAAPPATSNPDALLRADLFEVPFTYGVPAGLTLTTNRLEPKIVSLSARTTSNGPIGTLTPNTDLYPLFSSGIVIASTADALMDSCPRHVSGSTISAGDDVPSLLRDYAGFTFETTPTTVAGLPASVTSDIKATCLDHLHVGGNSQDLASTMALDRSPEKIYFVPVGTTTVLIQIWGSTSWFPTADQIVQSIQFTDQPAL